MSQVVTVPSELGGSGNTYSNDNDPATGMGANGHRVRLIPLLGDCVAMAGTAVDAASRAEAAATSALNREDTMATSSTSLTIGADGSTLNFTFDQDNKAFIGGHALLMASRGDPSNQMTVRIDDYDGVHTVQGTILFSDGAGTHADWDIALTSANQSGVSISRQVTGGGLVTGGGDLSANRVLTVTAATVQQVWAGASGVVTTPEVWAEAQESQGVTFGSTVTLDGHDGFNFHLTATGDFLLNDPDNFQVGRSGVITVIQDGTGGRLGSFGPGWWGSGGTPDFSTAPGAVDDLYYYVRAANEIHFTLVRNFTT